MKKLIIVTAVIALLAVIVFGVQAQAAKPIRPSSVAIETIGDNVTTDESDIVDIIYDYRPQIRHVNLTVYFEGLELSDKAELMVLMPPSYMPTLETITTDGLYTYEFDTCYWHLELTNYVGSAGISYYVTTTFEH